MNSRAKIEEQAATWAAKLDGGSLSEADRIALDRWLAADDAHRTILSEFCQLSADLEERLPALVMSGVMAMPAVEPRPRWRRFAPWVFGTALVSAAAALAVGVWFRPSPVQTETVATSVAERRTLRLADGSVLELNARTSVLVELGAHERHVRMADGEAFFTVAKDKSRPFIVETPSGSVRVTGTIFDVHAESAADLAVTVVEGSVQVTPCATTGHATGPVALVANDQFVVTPQQAGQVRQLSGTEIEDALAWRRGEAVFEGMPLGEALARFSRYHGRAITATPEAARLTVGGRYKLDNLDGFLNDIQAFLPVQVRRNETTGAIQAALRPAAPAP